MSRENPESQEEADFVVLRGTYYVEDSKPEKLSEKPPEVELFEMVYQWGRVGVMVDATAPAYVALIKAIRKGG